MAGMRLSRPLATALLATLALGACSPAHEPATAGANPTAPSDADPDLPLATAAKPVPTNSCGVTRIGEGPGEPSIDTFRCTNAVLGCDTRKLVVTTVPVNAATLSLFVTSSDFLPCRLSRTVTVGYRGATVTVAASSTNIPAGLGHVEPVHLANVPIKRSTCAPSVLTVSTGGTALPEATLNGCFTLKHS